MIYNALAVFVGGGAGALLRYGVSCAGKALFHMSIVGTLTVNLIGCFLMGYVFGITADRVQAISPVIKLLITVGFLGGLTTFSTFSLEGFELIKNGKITAALFYIVGSCVLSLALIFIGYSIARQ